MFCLRALVSCYPLAVGKGLGSSLLMSTISHAAEVHSALSCTTRPCCNITTHTFCFSFLTLYLSKSDSNLLCLLRSSFLAQALSAHFLEISASSKAFLTNFVFVEWLIEMTKSVNCRDLKFSAWRGTSVHGPSTSAWNGTGKIRNTLWLLPKLAWLWCVTAALHESHYPSLNHIRDYDGASYKGYCGNPWFTNCPRQKRVQNGHKCLMRVFLAIFPQLVRSRGQFAERVRLLCGKFCEHSRNSVMANRRFRWKKFK